MYVSVGIADMEYDEASPFLSCFSQSIHGTRPRNYRTDIWYRFCFYYKSNPKVLLHQIAQKVGSGRAVSCKGEEVGS